MFIDLASVHSAAENDALWEMTGGASDWIGFNDEGAEGRWRWSDGTAVDYQ